MNNKKILLFLLSLLLITGVFSIPFYSHWFTSKFGDDVAMITDQSQHMSIEDRMLSRFGGTKVFLDVVKASLQKYGSANALVLLPPRNYILASKLKDGNVEIPEPAVFYYFTGYKAVTPTSKDVRRADWVIVTRDHQMMMHHVNSPEMIDTVLAIFKPFL